jgi:hypothetical protein
MQTEQNEQQLAGQLGQQLRDSEDELDELTRARLGAARRRALEAAGTRPLWQRLGWSAGGFATAAVAVLALVLWHGGETPAPDLFGDDWELLAEGDLQLIEELEFYDWLPEEETAG